MADAAVEQPQTAGAEKDVKTTESTNDTKPTENGASNGEKKADEEDDFERYGSEKKEHRSDRRSDRRDRDDYKRRDFNDRGRRNDRGGRGGRGRGGRGGRGGYNNRHSYDRNNVKTRFERKDESSDATEIRRQVEFYFSDSNLPVDAYLLNEVGGPENRPVPLKTIHNFKRMRHYQPFSAVVDAVKGSYMLDVNDKDEVFRKKPLAEQFTLDIEKNAELLTSESMVRSVYAKGFGEEEENTAFKIEEFFEPYGVRGVRLRREKDGTFKGSVFVEFEDEAAAKQFLEMEEKPKFNDNELEIKSKKDYVDQKSQDIRDGKVKPNSPTRRSSNFRGDRNDRRDNRGKGDYKRKRDYDDDDDVDRDNWRERRDRFQKKGRRESPNYRSKREDGKDEEKTEEKKADEPKSEEQKKPEEAKVEETKAETEATA